MPSGRHTNQSILCSYYDVGRILQPGLWAVEASHYDKCPGYGILALCFHADQITMRGTLRLNFPMSSTSLLITSAQG